MSDYRSRPGWSVPQIQGWDVRRWSSLNPPDSLGDLGIDRGHRVEHCLDLKLNGVPFGKKVADLFLKAGLFRFDGMNPATKLGKLLGELLIFFAHLFRKLDRE